MEKIFLGKRENYNYFLNLLAKHILSVTDIYAYCLLKNHFHLLIKITDFKAEQKFSNFFNAYAKAYNRKYNRTGKLFEDRFKRKEITDDFYLIELIYYIHSNSQKHKITVDFRDYPFSSYLSIISAKKIHLKREKVLQWFGGIELFEKYHLEKKNDLVVKGLFGDFT